MELTNQFKVNVPVDRAWAVLTDVERIAPCLPGAELTGVEGDDYHGVVKVKVGPITAQYKGTARFVEKDETAHKAVLRAEGRETRGQGNASATVTATLEGAGEVTEVSVVTDLTVAGKVAQFGRGVLADVSNKLLGQFVESLESTVLSAPDEAPSGAASSDGTGAATTETAGATGTTGTGGSSTEAKAASVDLLKVVGPSLLKRVLPVLAAGGLVVALVAVLRRRRG